MIEVIRAGQRHFSDFSNRLFPVASGQGIPGAVTFHTDASIYRCAVDEGREVSHDGISG